jgi:hypothetical protein
MTVPAYTKADRKPTWTSKVERALRDADDFLSFAQLLELTGASPNQLGATLFHLQKRRVVEAVEGAGHLWWFLTGEDTRTSVVTERVSEPVGNRTRKGTPRKPKPKTE